MVWRWRPAAGWAWLSVARHRHRRVLWVPVSAPQAFCGVLMGSVGVSRLSEVYRGYRQAFQGAGSFKATRREVYGYRWGSGGGIVGGGGGGGCFAACVAAAAQPTMTSCRCMCVSVLAGVLGVV